MHTPKISKRKEVFYSVLLLIAAAIWGSAFMVMKDIQAAMPLNYVLTFRFGISALGLVYFLFISKQRFSKTLVWQGAVTGLLLYAAFSVQNWGLVFTTASKNALLTSMYVVLVPFMLWALRGETVGKSMLMAAVLCFAGIAILNPPDSSSWGRGDVLSIAGAVLYAAHIVAVSIYSRKTDIMSLTAMQFTFSCLFSGLAAISFNSFPTTVMPTTWAALAWLGVAATLLAMTLMNIGIKYVSSTKTTVILSTEALFGCIFGTLFQNDPVTLTVVLGGSLIFVAVVLSQATTKPEPQSQQMPSVAAAKPVGICS